MPVRRRILSTIAEWWMKCGDDSVFLLLVFAVERVMLMMVMHGGDNGCNAYWW